MRMIRRLIIFLVVYLGTTVTLFAEVHVADVLELVGMLSDSGYDKEYLDYIRFTDSPRFRIDQKQDTIVAVMSRAKDGIKERFNIAVVGTQGDGVRNIPQHDLTIMFYEDKDTANLFINRDLQRYLYRWDEDSIKGYNFDSKNIYLFLRVIVDNGNYKYHYLKVGEPVNNNLKPISLIDILKNIEIYKEVPYIKLWELEDRKNEIDSAFEINQENDTIIIALAPYRQYSGSENIHIYGTRQGMYIYPIKVDDQLSYSGLSFAFDEDKSIEQWDADSWVKHILKEWNEKYIKTCAKRTQNSSDSPGYEFTYIRVIIKDGIANYDKITTYKLIYSPTIYISPRDLEDLW